jgi:fructose-bisphosphate aldolase class II
MPLTTNLELQLKGREKGYAVGAFNTSNLEITQAIIEAAEEKRSPVIIETTEKALKYAGDEILGTIIKLLANKANIPVSLHLDHGKDIDTIERCIQLGWTSVMIDASDKSLEENIEITQQIVEFAHAKGVSVEAELGRLSGIEDDVSINRKKALFTDPEEAEFFVKKTKCDALAVAIGTSHGAYKFKGEPKLDFHRLKEIAQKTNVLLVLHGASSVISPSLEKAKHYGAKIEGAKGIPPDDIKKAIELGITKVNIDTDLRMAFTAGIREIFEREPEVFDPRKILSFAKDEIKKIVSSKIDLLGSANMI